MDLGYFETSLDVRDIARSLTFYQALGFEAVDGDVVDQRPLGPRGLGQAVDGEVVGDLVEVDADRAEAHPAAV